MFSSVKLKGNPRLGKPPVRVVIVDGQGNLVPSPALKSAPSPAAASAPTPTASSAPASSTSARAVSVVLESAPSMVGVPFVIPSIAPVIAGRRLERRKLQRYFNRKISSLHDRRRAASEAQHTHRKQCPPG
eukprot:GHVT01040919.1.p1 GENE.GHVT01040919.1~~GHVT01040919.1.p1  ORF type:complete len:131 (+),score=25.98 GHVT01040919.1:520-912(+)